MEKVLPRLIEKGFLAAPDITGLKEKDLNYFFEFLEKQETKPMVIDNQTVSKFLESIKPKFNINKLIDKREQIETKVKLKKNYVASNKKINIHDWATYYFDRYNRLRDLLQNREELKNVISISRAIKTDGRQRVALIGMVASVIKTFAGSYIIELEDPSGSVKVSLKNPDLKRKTEEITEDEVVGIVGTASKNFVYAENIIFPEVPEKPIKKTEDEVYGVFLSDIHVGSNMFLAKEFHQCVKWISGEMGNAAQKKMAQKIRYVCVSGDLVDGIGIYPGQEKELVIKNIYDQYTELAKYLAMIPDDINIVLIPGNHDAVRLAEPQPALFKDLAYPLYELPNITIGSNPSWVNLHNIGKFPGYDALLYHGYSFDHYLSNTPALRKYGYDRTDLMQEFLLRKRHLAPTHGSTVLNPAMQDFLVMDKTPDIFAVGHTHRTSISRYKNILNLSCGCFQGTTTFQEKLGHTPDPGKVPIVNLQKNEAKLMRFR